MARTGASITGFRRRVSRPAIWARVIELAPAVATYVVNSIDRVRVAKLDHINRQIEHLYGPLYALTQADDKAWRQFENTYARKGRRYFLTRAILQRLKLPHGDCV